MTEKSKNKATVFWNHGEEAITIILGEGRWQLRLEPEQGIDLMTIKMRPYETLRKSDFETKEK